jgi:light-harvesting complex I chlorophyll a/b binding protein 5
LSGKLASPAARVAVAAMASTVTAANSHGSVLRTRTAPSKPLAGWSSRRTLAMPAHHARSPRARVVAVRAAGTQRPTWLPGLDPPPHLDGTSVF